MWLDDFANNHKQYCIARWQDLLTENHAKEAKQQVKEREEITFALVNAHSYVPNGASKLTVDVLKHAIRCMRNDYPEL